MADMPFSFRAYVSEENERRSKRRKLAMGLLHATIIAVVAHVSCCGISEEINGFSDDEERHRVRRCLLRDMCDGSEETCTENAQEIAADIASENAQEISIDIASENGTGGSSNLSTARGGQEGNRGAKWPRSNDTIVGMLGEIFSSYQAFMKSCGPVQVSQLVDPKEILLALQEIPKLARTDFLRAYGMLARDDRQFKSFMALPMDMRKDWLLLEIGVKYA